MSKTGVVSRGREKEGRGKARDRNGEGGPRRQSNLRQRANPRGEGNNNLKFSGKLV